MKGEEETRNNERSVISKFKFGFYLISNSRSHFQLWWYLNKYILICLFTCFIHRCHQNLWNSAVKWQQESVASDGQDGWREERESSWGGQNKLSGQAKLETGSVSLQAEDKSVNVSIDSSDLLPPVTHHQYFQSIRLIPSASAGRRETDRIWWARRGERDGGTREEIYKERREREGGSEKKDGKMWRCRMGGDGGGR